MGLFRRKSDAEHLVKMQDQLQSMADRLDRADDDKAELQSRLDRLTTSVTTPPTEPPPEPPPPPSTPPPPSPETEFGARLETLADTVEEQRARLADLALVATDASEKAAAAPAPDEEVRAQLAEIVERMTAIDGRVDQISVELTNQLSELSNELDALQRRDDGPDLSALDGRLDDITSGQERLANEQARYQIRFREDLAELADRIRRPGAN